MLEDTIAKRLPNKNRARARPKDVRKASSVPSSAPDPRRGHGPESSHSPWVPANSLHSFSLESSSSSAVTLCCVLVRITGAVILVQSFRGEITLKLLLVTKVMACGGKLAGGMTKLENYYTISPSIGRDYECHTGSCNGKLSKGSQQNPFMKSRSSSANMINSLEWR